MRRVTLGIVVALGAVLSYPPSSQAATRDGRVGVAKATSTLFKASFGKGLKGWVRKNASDWKATAGGVSFSGTQDELLAPFSTAKLHDFAVQATIKAVGTPSQATSGYGVVVRAKTPTDGISGGSVKSDIPYYNLPLLLWSNNSVGGAGAALNAGYNVFRIEVHGTDYSLSINGTHIVSFTIAGVSPAASFKRIGVWAVAQKIQVKSLVVTRLGVATALSPLPPVDNVNLSAGDVPAGLQSLGNSYFTDEELAQLNNASPDSITSTGLLLSHQASYVASPTPSSGPYGAFSYVYAYSSPETAEAGLSLDWNNEQAAKAQSPNFSTSSLTGIGNEAHMLTYDYTESGDGSAFKGTIVAIFFRRGAYEVNIYEDFVAGSTSAATMLADTTAMAKIVDGRIQRLG